MNDECTELRESLGFSGISSVQVKTCSGRQGHSSWPALLEIYPGCRNVLLQLRWPAVSMRPVWWSLPVRPDPIPNPNSKIGLTASSLSTMSN